MKKILLLLLATVFVLGAASVGSDAFHGNVTPAQHKTRKHKAHKATKHKAPKRSHKTV